MGVDYHASAVIGIQIPGDLLNVVKEERGCPHDVPKASKFCETCGAPRLTTEENQINLDELVSRFNKENQTKLELFEETDGVAHYIGVGAGVWSDCGKQAANTIISTNTLSSVETAINAFVPTLPFKVPPQPIQLWAIMYCSY